MKPMFCHYFVIILAFIQPWLPHVLYDQYQLAHAHPVHIQIFFNSQVQIQTFYQIPNYLHQRASPLSAHTSFIFKYLFSGG